MRLAARREISGIAPPAIAVAPAILTIPASLFAPHDSLATRTTSRASRSALPAPANWAPSCRPQPARRGTPRNGPQTTIALPLSRLDHAPADSRARELFAEPYLVPRKLGRFCFRGHLLSFRQLGFLGSGFSPSEWKVEPSFRKSTPPQEGPS